MLIIPIKDGENIDRALKRFKRKFDKTGTKRSLQTRKEFVKPSIKKEGCDSKSPAYTKTQRPRRYIIYLQSCRHTY